MKAPRTQPVDGRIRLTVGRACVVLTPAEAVRLAARLTRWAWAEAENSQRKANQHGKHQR